MTVLGRALEALREREVGGPAARLRQRLGALEEVFRDRKRPVDLELAALFQARREGATGEEAHHVERCAAVRALIEDAHDVAAAYLREERGVAVEPSEIGPRPRDLEHAAHVARTDDGVDRRLERLGDLPDHAPLAGEHVARVERRRGRRPAGILGRAPELVDRARRLPCLRERGLAAALERGAQRDESGLVGLGIRDARVGREGAKHAEPTRALRREHQVFDGQIAGTDPVGARLEDGRGEVDEHLHHTVVAERRGHEGVRERRAVEPLDDAVGPPVGEHAAIADARDRRGGQRRKRVGVALEIACTLVRDDLEDERRALEADVCDGVGRRARRIVEERVDAIRGVHELAGRERLQRSDPTDRGGRRRAA